MITLRRLLWGLVVFVLLAGTSATVSAEDVWRVGIATAKITPEQPVWMAGYGSRDRPAEATLTDLWLKVAALEAADGRLGIIVTSDLLVIPRGMYDRLASRLKDRFGLDRSQVMFTCSHTHCGPVLQNALPDIYPLDEKNRELIERYSKDLEEKIVSTIGQAIKNLQAATLSAAVGKATFAVNRRNNPEQSVPEMREKGIPLAGPVDHSVPVLAARGSSGDLRAVLFGYACHCTTLNFYQWCGDYAGFAELMLQKSHPGSVAMFWQGCGADQNPLPRRKVELCRQYGQMLANGVEQVLEQPMRPIKPRLQTAMAFVTLEFDGVFSRKDLESHAKQGKYLARRAERLLKQLDQGKELPTSYPYPVQVWKLGDDQLWIALGGEVVVEYSLKCKEIFGPKTWVAGYTNDVMGYIPSDRVQAEGGYEAAAFHVYGLPSRGWAPGAEQRIITTIQKLVKQLESSEKVLAADTCADKPAPHVVFLVSEDPNNYEAHKSIPPFAQMLRREYGFRCTVIQGKGEPGAFRFPGLEVLKEADLLVVFFRRRALSTQQLDLIRGHLKAGKPLVGIRTANHAFSVHGEVAEGYQKWWEFVPEVLGCKNHGYGPAEAGTDVAIIPETAGHPILQGIQPRKWHSGGSLYLVKPLVDTSATVLLAGSVENNVEPVAWTRRCGTSRVFYTSLGYPDDFKLAQFRRFLINGICWALDRTIPASAAPSEVNCHH